MTITQDQLNRLQLFYGVREIQKHWGWLLAIGIALIVLGILAIGYSTFTTLASVVFLGFILLAGGVIQALQAFVGRNGQGFWFSLMAGVLYSVVGLALLVHPAAAALTLTLILAGFYMVSGLFKIFGSISARFENWGWIFFSGLVSLALGLLIWSEWPMSGLWIIGLFVGIDLIFVGSFWAALALNARDLSKHLNRG